MSSETSFHIDSIGYLHNIILNELEEENPGGGKQNLSSTELMNLLIPKMEKYGYVLTEDEKVQIINDAITTAPTIDAMVSPETVILHYKKVVPKYIDKLEILEIYAIGVSELPENTIPKYTNGYAKIIIDSDLPEQEKEVLVGSVLVGGNSAILWNIEEEISE